MRRIPYGRQYLDQQDFKEILDVLKGDWITQGPKIGEFEKSLAEYCGVRYAVAVSSGTAALHLACLASGLKKGDNAITSPITFLATPNSVLYAGARPVFADIDYETINADPDEIKRKITGRTRVILPVHFAGLPCDMEKIRNIAKKNNIIVIEDACHALGAEYRVNGRWIRIGSCAHSDMTAFSFHPVKHITTGEGGAVATNSRRLYERLKALRSHGVYKDKKTLKKTPWYYEMIDLGFNYRITDFQCALGISQLKKIDNFIKRRREIVQSYKKAFSDAEGIICSDEKEYTMSSWHIFTIRVKKNRDKIFNALKSKGIGVNVHYIPVYLHPYYKGLGYKKGLCPKAEEYYRETITLPLYYKMTERDVKRVIEAVTDLVRI